MILGLINSIRKWDIKFIDKAEELLTSSDHDYEPLIDVL